MSQFDEALGSLSDTVLECEDPRDLAETLLALQKARSHVTQLIDMLQNRLYKVMDRKEIDLGPGLGVIRRSREVKTSWNHEEMLNLVLDQHRKVNPDTGEVEINGFELANALKELVAFSYWRKTALRDAKIDFSEYVTEVYGQPRVRFMSKDGI